MKPKPNSFQRLLGAIIATAILTYVFNTREKAQMSQNSAANVTTSASMTKPPTTALENSGIHVASSSAPPPLVAAPQQTQGPPPASEAWVRAKTFFHRELISIEAVSHIYQTILKSLPPGQDSELLALYAAEGIVRNGSSEFAHFMTDLHQSLDERSQALYDMIIAQEQTLMTNSYTYQMTLNLAAHLKLPPEKKARLLGGAMGIHFATDPVRGVSAMSSNITNAFILMKNNGVTEKDAAPYIQRGIDVNKDNPVAAKEFAARANTYYPGSVK